MELHTIQTHVASDSSGKVCGIEAKHFAPILIALIASIIFFALISLAAKEGSMLIKILIGFLPLVLSIGYVAVFLVRRPPHFQRDFFENIFGGQNFNVVKINKGKNPLIKLVE